MKSDSPPSEDGYKNITSQKPLPDQLSFYFLDAYTHLRTRRPTSEATTPIPPRQSAPYGPAHTYTGFSAPGRTRTTRIDFIMLASALTPRNDAAAGERVEGRGGWEVGQYACVDNWLEEGDADGWQGRWSDHRAVRVTIRRL